MLNNATPKVSVLIPSYNSAHFLHETIESVLNQTYTDFELIIVDDQSKDNTDEVIQKYISDPRVHYYKNEKNLGLVGNWNCCLTYAKGEYIKFLMCDDKFHTQLLEKYVPIMEQYPNVSLLTSFREYFGSKTYVWQLPFCGLQNGKWIIHESLKDCNFIGEPTTVMFRRESLRKIGDFNTNFTYLPDWDMWLRQLTIGDCFIIPEPLSYFRIHPNQTTQVVMKNLSNYFEEYDFYENIRKWNYYKVDFSEINIDALIKIRALYCSKVIFKSFLSFKIKSNWPFIIKALKILRKEHIPIRMFFRLLSKKPLYQVATSLK